MGFVQIYSKFLNELSIIGNFLAFFCFYLTILPSLINFLGMEFITRHIDKKIQQDRKWQVADASSLKLNLTDPCRTVPCQYHSWGMPGRRARSPIAVYARVQCRDPKQGRKGSILLWRPFTLRIFLLFIYGHTVHRVNVYCHWDLKKCLYPANPWFGEKNTQVFTSNNFPKK